MTTFKRFSLALAISFLALLINVQAQTPSVSAVNLTPDEQQVRISTVGDVLDMRVAVSDESGDVVFESGPVADNKLDWTMRDAQGRRVAPGAYNLTVTYRTANGKLRRRVEQVFVTEEVAGSAKQESAAPAAAAPVEGAGTTGRIAKFTAANTLGNSVLFESGGRIGLGTTAPQQSLHALGVSSRLRLHSTGGASLSATEYVNNVARTWQAGAGGSTAAGVQSKFFIRDHNANQYRLVIDTSGNFGIGTLAPASRLTVNGGIQILGAGNGIKFPDGSIQTKATSGTINGTGTANRLAKFTGANSFGNSSITEVNGRVGIGTTLPEGKLQVIADTGEIGVYGDSTSGFGVYGYSAIGRGVSGFSSSGNGVHGESTTGYAGYFEGGVRVSGHLEAYGGMTLTGGMTVSGGCSGCTAASSDRNLKANLAGVDPRLVLDRLAALPIKSWNYKTDGPAVRHVGPMAQDFRAAFNLGADDKHIDMIDANGVTMASVQALYQLMQEKDRQIERQGSQMAEQGRQIQQLKAQLNKVRRAVRRRAAGK